MKECGGKSTTLRLHPTVLEELLRVAGGDGAASPSRHTRSAEHTPVARGDHGVDAWADGGMSSEGEGTELEDEQLLSSHGS